MAQQLAYMILLQALRLHLQEGSAQGVGWLFALADPPIRTAMAWMHDAPGHKWTLQGLADLKIDLQDYSPAHVPLPRVDVDIIFTVSPPNDSSRMIRSFPCSIRGLFASEEHLREYGLLRLRWN